MIANYKHVQRILPVPYRVLRARMARNRPAIREDEGLGEEVLEAEEDGDVEKLQELYEKNRE